MFYLVEWQLVSWIGMRSELVELSEVDLLELEQFFEQVKVRHKIYRYRIKPAKTMTKTSALEAFWKDIEDETEETKRGIEE